MWGLLGISNPLNVARFWLLQGTGGHWFHTPRHRCFNFRHFYHHVNRRDKYASLTSPLRIGVFRDVRYASCFKTLIMTDVFVAPETACQETRSQRRGGPQAPSLFSPIERGYPCIPCQLSSTSPQAPELGVYAEVA